MLVTHSIVDFNVVSETAKGEIFPEYTIISIEDYSESTLIHKLSHQHLHIQFWKIKVKEEIENGIDAEKLKTFPFPIVLYNFIEKQEINC